MKELPPLGITDEMRRHYSQVWRASEELLVEIHRLLYTHEPKVILETGPGLTSVLFYEYQRKNPDVVYMSLNHPTHWHDIFINHMHELGYDTSMAFKVPVVDQYFVTDDIPDGIKFDFMFLDGPPGSGDRASVKAEKFLTSVVHEKSIVIQDDTNRNEEASIINLLHGHLGLDRHEKTIIQDGIYKHRRTTVLTPKELL